MIEWRFLMFLHQVYFYFCRRFRIEFLKNPSSEMLHFSIALQRTSTYTVCSSGDSNSLADRQESTSCKTADFKF